MSVKEEKIVSDSEKTKDRTSEEDKSGQVGQESGPGHSGSVHCGSSGSTLVPNNPAHIPTLNEVTDLTPNQPQTWNGNLVMYPTQTGGSYHNNTHIPHYLTTCYPFVQESYYFLPQSNCYRSQVRERSVLMRHPYTYYVARETLKCDVCSVIHNLPFLR